MNIYKSTLYAVTVTNVGKFIVQAETDVDVEDLKRLIGTRLQEMHEASPAEIKSYIQGDLIDRVHKQCFVSPIFNDKALTDRISFKRRLNDFLCGTAKVSFLGGICLLFMVPMLCVPAVACMGLGAVLIAAVNWVAKEEKELNKLFFESL